MAAQDAPARVRMGFFALDPNAYDLYIDGEPAPVWGSGFANDELMAGIIYGGWEYINCCSSSPYLSIPAGTHSFAFTPTGAELNDAVLGPIDIRFEGGHAYALAVVGAVEDESLNILPIDETAEFANADPLTDLNIILVNNVPGMPSVYLGADLNATVDYADYFTTSVPGGTAVVYDVYTDETQTTPVLRVDFPAQPPGLTEFHVMVGPLPGSDDTRNRFSFNHGNPGDVTINERGEVLVGRPLNDAIPGATQRNRYTLTLDAPVTLDITAHGTGESTADSIALAPFDSVLFLYDAQGRPLFWNDEDTHTDDWIEDSNFDAGIDALPLAAGTYFIEVGGVLDLMAGPYELTVEVARPAA